MEPFKLPLHLCGELQSFGDTVKNAAVSTKAVLLACIEVLLSAPEFINYDLEKQLEEERDILVEQLRGDNTTAFCGARGIGKVGAP